MVRIIVAFEIPAFIFRMFFGLCHEYTKANLENLIEDHLKWGVSAKILEISGKDLDENSTGK